MSENKTENIMRLKDALKTGCNFKMDGIEYKNSGFSVKKEKNGEIFIVSIAWLIKNLDNQVEEVIREFGEKESHMGALDSPH